MKTSLFALLLFALMGPSWVRAAGWEHDENFVVLAPDQASAAMVLAKANEYRKQLALEWVGEELPPSIGQTMIHVEYSKSEDSALTWPIDSRQRTMHKLWLTTTPDKVTGKALYHEMTHIVLNTRFPERLPAWADEGAASMKDDDDRRATRERILAWYAKSGNWPALETVLDAPVISADNRAAYSVASSLTQYLLTRGDRSTFLEFAQSGKARGWDRALKQYYKIAGVRDLESAWQAWIKPGDRTSRRPTIPPAVPQP
jgi:hypothetical protein